MCYAANFRLGQMFLNETNASAYYEQAYITIVKCFTQRDPGLTQIFAGLNNKVFQKFVQGAALKKNFLQL